VVSILPGMIALLIAQDFCGVTMKNFMPAGGLVAPNPFEIRFGTHLRL
jgi:hypothetical protein